MVRMWTLVVVDDKRTKMIHVAYEAFIKLAVGGENFNKVMYSRIVKSFIAQILVEWEISRFKLF